MSASHSAHSHTTLRKAVIPAAGLGTRLQPLTRALPKELLPVGRQPVLAHIAAELRGAGITEALFIVSERKPQIRAYFGDEYTGDAAPDATESADMTEAPPLRCAYVTQREQKGLGDALLYAQDWVGEEPFVVAFGDCLMDAPETPGSAGPLRRLIAAHLSRQALATVLVEAVPWEKVSLYGVPVPKHPMASLPTEPFAVVDIVEKPRREAAPSNLVVAARWVLQPDLFAALRQTPLDARGELNLTDAIHRLCMAGAALWAVPLLSGEARRDIGNFETFFVAFVRAALHDPQAGAAARRAAEEVLNEIGIKAD